MKAVDTTTEPGSRRLPAGVIRGRERPAPPGVATPVSPSPSLPPSNAGLASGPVVDAGLDQRMEVAARAVGAGELSRPQQRLVRAVADRRSVFAVAPDSAGLRAAVHVAAQLSPSPVVVVSPREAVLREQYERLCVRRVPTVLFVDEHGGTTDRGGEGRGEALARVAAGGPLLVFATVAALRDAELSRALRTSGVAALCIEEAHAASEWSHELSPSLQSLPLLLTELAPASVIALAPAATPIVSRDVAERFLLRHATTIELPLVRPNLSIECYAGRADARHRALVSLASRLRRPGLVFCPSAADADAVAAGLTAVRVPVHRYHGGLTEGERTAELLSFVMPGRRAVMVATSAFAPAASPPVHRNGEARIPSEFALRVEKRDLRFVIHYPSPASLEQLVREIDLAGRDGEAATAVLLYDPTDPRRWTQALAGLRPEPRLLVRVATELAGLAQDGRGTTLDSLALTAGVARSLASVHAHLLADAGFVRMTDGWVQPLVSRAALLDRARRLAASLETFALQDSERLRALYHLGEGRGCRTAAVLRYFGGDADARCGRCSVCTGSTAALWGDDDSAAPRRRPDARDFSVGRGGAFPPEPVAARAEEAAPSPEPLTSPLGELARS